MTMKVLPTPQERAALTNQMRLMPIPPLSGQKYENTVTGKVYVFDAELNEWFEPVPGFRTRFWNAGHILGSASAEMHVGGSHLLFSGDLGPHHKAFHADPVNGGVKVVHWAEQNQAT